jgi:uncharacterized protein (TIGR03067 family)
MVRRFGLVLATVLAVTLGSTAQEGAKKDLVKLDSSVLSEGTVVLDPGKNPKQMKVTSTAGPDKGQTKLGIYEIDGDMLKICFYMDDSGTKKRPAEFASAKDSVTSLAVMKRMKK